MIKLEICQAHFRSGTVCDNLLHYITYCNDSLLVFQQCNSSNFNGLSRRKKWSWYKSFTICYANWSHNKHGWHCTLWSCGCHFHFTSTRNGAQYRTATCNQVGQQFCMTYKCLETNWSQKHPYHRTYSISISIHLFSIYQFKGTT